MAEINGINLLTGITASTIARTRSSIAGSNNLILHEFNVTVFSVLDWSPRNQN
jgi:hypothetical protein